jgi:Bacterial regulatory proteins, luxR family
MLPGRWDSFWKMCTCKSVSTRPSGIGQALRISYETTRKHITRIIDKLGVRNHTHTAIISKHATISGDN